MFIRPINNFQAELTQDFEPFVDGGFYVDNISEYGGGNILETGAASIPRELTIIDETNGRYVNIIVYRRSIESSGEWQIYLDDINGQIVESAPDDLTGITFPSGCKVVSAGSVAGIQYLGGCSEVGAGKTDYSGDIDLIKSVQEGRSCVIFTELNDNQDIALPGPTDIMDRPAGNYINIRLFCEYEGSGTWSDNLTIFDGQTYQNVAINGSAPSTTDPIKLLNIHYFLSQSFSSSVYIYAEWLLCESVTQSNPS